MMMKKIGISVVVFLLLLLLQTKVNAALEINLVNKSNSNQYYWKNDTAYMEIETVTKDDEQYNIVFLSTEFYENFFKFSYYDQKNQIFYFNKKDNVVGNYYVKRDDYVKGNDNRYYEGDNTFALTRDLHLYTKIIDGKLYIPLAMYRQDFAISLQLGYDENSNSLIFFGPTKSGSLNETFPTIDNIEIKETIYESAFYYNPNKYVEDFEYLTIDYLKSQKYGYVDYYSAIIDNKSCNIRVYYKYEENSKNPGEYQYVYDKYEIISKPIDGNVIGKLDVVGKYLKIEKENKYGIVDTEGNIILDTIYDEITLEDIKSSFTLHNIDDNLVKLKKDNKYTLYSLDSNKNILQDKWFDDIVTSAIIEIDTPSSVNEIHGSNKPLNMICVYDKEKFGIVLGENVLTDAIYTKVEAIQISYTYIASNDLIDSVKTIIAYKLYKDDEIHILASYKVNDRFSHIYNDYYSISNDRFSYIGNGYYISNDSYKNVTVQLENNEYNVYGMIDNDNQEKIVTLKQHEDYSFKEDKNLNYVWIIMGVLLVVFIIVLLHIL